jgi:segregation and condensation protein A
MPAEILSKPPLNILIDTSLVKRKSPWEINISELLDMFLKAVASSGLIDMKAAGTAALSSATIYRLKVETLFFFERLRLKQQSSNIAEPPQFIVMPFRYEVYSTTLEELFEELSRILEKIAGETREEGETSFLKPEEEEPPRFEDYLQTLQSLFVEFKKILYERLGAEGKVMLSELLAGLSTIDAARVFILLLFAANNGEVVINQEEGEEDALIVSVGQIG